MPGPTAAPPPPEEPGDAGGVIDCLVVGGGPAGLTAAIYLARFHRSVVVVDRGDGRTGMIPRSRNQPGYPAGIVGADLLDNMADQARAFGARLLRGEVTGIAPHGKQFAADTSAGRFQARTVLLATGVVNHRPPLAEAVHDDAVQRGLLRYCPICDGYEQTGRWIGVLGGDRHGLAEALFLRTYSVQIILLSLTAQTLTDDEQAQADTAGVRVARTPVSSFDFGDAAVTITLADGDRVTVDTLYAALGSHTRNDLGKPLGVDLVNGQCFATDAHQRTSVPGIYAAGDAVEGLDQISVAMGTGARAAVAIHNDLRDSDGQTLRD